MNSEDMLLQINSKLTGGDCPKPGCLGECAAIYHVGLLESGRDLYEAYIYLWKDNFEGNNILDT